MPKTEPGPVCSRRTGGALRVAAVVLALAASLVTAPGLRAQNAAEFDDHIATLINRGRLAEARAALLAAPASNADRLVFEGRVLKSQGRHEAAIRLFRQALEQDPAHLFARRELAHSLFQTGHHRAARRELLHLIRTDRSPRLQSGYRAFLRQIEENRPFRAGLQVAVEPSTNINRGTYETLLDSAIGSLVIDDSYRAQSGFGLTVTALGQWRRPVSQTDRLRLGWQVSRSVYPSYDRLNRTHARIELGYSRDLPRRSWNIAPYIGRSWNADGSDMAALGLSAGGVKQARPGRRVYFAFDAEKRVYDTLTVKNGPYAVAKAGIDQDVGGGATLTGEVILEVSRPEAAAQAYDGISLQIGARNRWPAGIATEFAVFGGMRDFRGVFPLTTLTRADRFAGLSASMTLENRPIGRFVPRIGCAAYRNRSNLSLYSYTAQSCSLTFESLF